MHHGITRVGALMGLLLATACSESATSAQPTKVTASLGRGGFEVWILDQSGTQPGNASGYGGTLHIFEGSSLMGTAAASAQPVARIDLAPLKDGVCQATGKIPVRPHMIQFNREETHAIVSFVASGHVVIFDAENRTPVACFLTSQSATGQQAHAAIPRISRRQDSPPLPRRCRAGLVARIDVLGLQHVLVRDGIELPDDNLARRRIGAGDDRLVDRRPDPEGVAIGVLERDALRPGSEVCAAGDE